MFKEVHAYSSNVDWKVIAVVVNHFIEGRLIEVWPYSCNSIQWIEFDLVRFIKQSSVFDFVSLIAELWKAYLNKSINSWKKSSRSHTRNKNTGSVTLK